jgi:recombination protein RecT
MPRPQQLLYPQREPTKPVPAATLLWVRNEAQGRLQVLMTRRSAQASFAPGAYVFPGGGIDPADHTAHPLATRRPTQPDPHLTQALAALRESFEELGVIRVLRPDGQAVQPEALSVLQRNSPFWPQLEALGWKVDAAALHLLAHWTTDRDLPRRFDVPFWVGLMPEGQTPVADEREQFDPIWICPHEALERHKAGLFFMIFPTIRTLEHLNAYPNAEALLNACAATEAPMWTSCPRAGLLNGREMRYMETDAPYGELELVCPDGAIHHRLDWNHDQATPLLRHVQRLTAPNPGVMTGPGTNSYVVGDPTTGHMVIDPGPNDAEHLERLWRAAGGDIRMIVCTHSHPDHSPGARPLQALCLERPTGHGVPPILGLPSAPTARADSQFEPDRPLADGELLVLQALDLVDDTITLQVIHTPGHAANHLCLAMLEDALLFSGDHILNGSTTVVNPPDGDMTQYLDSLDKLDAACAAHELDYILPAHGYVLHQARHQIAKLKAHRLQREAKVLRVMQAHPTGTLNDWVPLAYDDVPERIWPVAKRSLEAHVIRLRNFTS